eukprot:TRINITY_DN46125_c0_g1_i1.p2 TRINITY_DN46125_c0_g1~~TRINITY_DN46125_c0_g1_i1.p2  ORF type:complete len:131 (-),score=23.51 TRINITY_DN46125_c0_g1_i1:478-870(-)
MQGIIIATDMAFEVVRFVCGPKDTLHAAEKTTDNVGRCATRLLLTAAEHPGLLLIQAWPLWVLPLVHQYLATPPLASETAATAAAASETSRNKETSAAAAHLTASRANEDIEHQRCVQSNSTFRNSSSIL